MKALVVRLDGFGGVLLAGPAVRAVAARADRVTLLCTPGGAPAARLLPHVDEVIVRQAPSDGTAREAPRASDGADGPAGEPPDEGALLRRLRAEAYDVALVLAPYGQSALPAVRLLREARVPRIGADGRDGTRPPGGHDVDAALDTAAAMGFTPRAGDDGRLRVVPPPDTVGLTGNGPYVVVHPGGSGDGEPCAPDRYAESVALLADAGHRVVVTGGPRESALTGYVSGGTAVDLGGRTDARRLSGVLRAADVVVAGAAGAVHLAAANGTPVVSLLPPAPAPEHRGPYRVPAALLGRDDVTAQDVAAAVRKLVHT
ncbi:glycosyltransferase family 9 protein [Streptomyces chromofuscus]|uniref:Glycosyltransferase family 9 protein n=1 Tax=Streptomyces chromofuscus TaxID=42881 RepID=A0A7M2TC99_STRCW|nr:glycosyltransferase family 9 protein [Streptomyces chromofuscus]QOV45338.1 glycosyltransferase family 9 protein [Streptomyces chromofuscus]GGS98362.1 glycosyl transferase [Streptomyces chromofuscus]